MKKTRIHDAGLGPGASSFDLEAELPNPLRTSFEMFACMTAEERELLEKIRNKKYHVRAKYLADPFFSETAKDASL
jgi:hypothetical protein